MARRVLSGSSKALPAIPGTQHHSHGLGKSINISELYDQAAFAVQLRPAFGETQERTGIRRLTAAMNKDEPRKSLSSQIGPQAREDSSWLNKDVSCGKSRSHGGR